MSTFPVSIHISSINKRESVLFNMYIMKNETND